MAAPRCTFEDPNSVRPTYQWQINWSEEEEFGKERNIQHAANTDNTGLVRQQSDDSPMVIQVRGVVLHKAQHTELIGWFALCKTQTIYLEDFAGYRYEVLFTAFKPTRKRTIKNPRDFTNAPLHYWEYEARFEVIRFLNSNPWAAAGP